MNLRKKTIGQRKRYEKLSAIMLNSSSSSCKNEKKKKKRERKRI